MKSLYLEANLLTLITATHSAGGKPGRSSQA